MPPKKKKETMCLNKTVSLPYAIYGRVLDVADLRGTDFSATLLMLLRIGLDVWESELRKDQQPQEVKP